MIGDHHQLPPVVKNMAFQKYSHLDQSLFTRFVRLGTPYTELNAQGRARPAIANLYNWRYKALGNLPKVGARLAPHAWCSACRRLSSRGALTECLHMRCCAQVEADEEYQVANAGFKYDFQFVDVPDFEGRGEFCPTPYFYQNLVRPALQRACGGLRRAQEYATNLRACVCGCLLARRARRSTS
eukprot:scaffold916_cov516-Prasinococcus_capsulatus_cf.AAC.3